MNKYYALIFISLFGKSAFSQDAVYEYHIVANANLYVPTHGSNKGLYPIIGYDETADPKLLIGGFGVGFSALRSVKEHLGLKAQVNLSKHTYWDEPVDLRGVNNEPLGTFLSGSSDYSLGLTGTVHYFISKKMSVGTGLGAQLLTITVSRLIELNKKTDQVSVEQYYKPFLPVLPIEWSLRGKKVLYNIRYEHGLSNRYKNGLNDYKTDRFGLVYFELGFKL
jgi:hypothetical protein